MMNILNNNLLKLLFFLTFSTSIFANITTTINPIYFLAKDIVGDTDKINVLLPNKSPHISSLSPSQVKLLNNSKIVFYIDENLETFIPSMEAKMPNTKFINIVESLNLTLLDSNSAKHNKEHEKYDEHEDHKGHGHNEHHHSSEKHHEEDHDDHQHGNKDTHIWLSPKNAMKITHLIAMTLSKEYPQNEKIYHQNTQKLMKKLQKLDKETDRKVHTHSHNQAIIFHNAYNYFFNRYHLEDFAKESLQNPNLSLKKVLELQKIIKKNEISCILSDKKYNPKVIKKLIKETAIKHQILNPLGSIEKDDYISLINYIANKVKDCL